MDTSTTTRRNHHGQAWPQEARPQALQGQPRKAAQRRFEVGWPLTASHDRGAADLDPQPLTKSFGCFLAAALLGDQRLHPLFDAVVAQAGGALLEVVAQLVAGLVGAFAVQQRPHLGECTDETRDKLRHHLEECPTCLRYYGVEE